MDLLLRERRAPSATVTHVEHVHVEHGDFEISPRPQDSLAFGESEAVGRLAGCHGETEDGRREEALGEWKGREGVGLMDVAAGWEGIGRSLRRSGAVGGLRWVCTEIVDCGIWIGQGHIE